MKQFIKECKETRDDLVKVVGMYGVDDNLELRTKIDSLLIMYDQMVSKLSERQESTETSEHTNSKALHIADVSRSFSEKDMISFGNFIRDNYYGVGSPRLISYEPDKRPHGTIEDIYKFWLAENYD